MTIPAVTNLKALESDTGTVVLPFDKDASRLDNIRWQEHMNRTGHSLTGFRYTDKGFIESQDAPIWVFVKTCC